MKMHCQSSGSQPFAEIHWYRGSERLRNAKTHQSPDGNSTFSTLDFTPSLSDLGATITCTAENKDIPNSAIHDSWKLDIHCKYQLSKNTGFTRKESEREANADFGTFANILRLFAFDRQTFQIIEM